jgi:acyl carrier protein
MTFTREKVRSELLALFSKHNHANVTVSESSELVGDLGIDSLGVMELLADIEDAFKPLQVPDEMLREVSTIGDVISTIEQRLAQDGRLAA